MQSLHTDGFNPYALAYLVIPDYAYKDSRLTLIQLKVYGFIHSYTNPFYFGNENIAKMFNCSERSISEALAKLEEYEYITMKHTPKAGGGTTRLAVDCESDSQYSSSRKSKNELTTRSTVLHKDIKDNNIKEKILENTKKTINVDDGFEEWLTLKRNKKTMKGKSKFGSYPSFKNSDFQSYPPKRRMGGIDASDIL